MRKVLGAFFIYFGLLSWAAVAWGLWESLLYVRDAAGSGWATLGFFLLPLTALIAPWHALLSTGDWLLLALVYGGFIAYPLSMKLGSAILPDK